MTSTTATRLPVVAPALAASIVIAWCICAVVLGQSPLAVQTSRQLLLLGAADGTLIQGGEWWRLFTSQLLHVHAAHMMFNAIGIALVGNILERRCGWLLLAVVILLGGTAGQLASVLHYPDTVSSGASQALMALCGAALVARLSRRCLVLVVIVLAVQVLLDLLSVHTIKAGHGWGFVAGLLIGALAIKRSAWAGSQRPDRQV